MRKIILAVFISAIFIIPFFASAHQPRIVQGETTEIKDPEISQAFYGELTGHPHYFEINSNKEFNLYAEILVPDIKGAETDISAEVIKVDGQKREVIGVLDGKSFAWKPFFEPFAGDSYFKGPDFSARVGAGQYLILVSSPSFWGKYSLVVGQKESFSPVRIFKTLTTLPILKMGFFGKSFFSIFFNYIGLGLLIILGILVGAVKIYRSSKRVRK